MNASSSNRRRAIWGAFLIAIGVLFLLEEMGTLDLAGWKTWWPAIPMLVGLVMIIAPERRRQIASGVSLVLIGLWLFACTYHWYGLRYHTAWPLLVVIFGAEMVVAALLDAGRTTKGEPHV